MQQTIGERLQQARKRMGISIEEASAKTKLRKDFLLKFEANEFDLPLPAVYQRGFLKNYARYLKLNVQSLMNDLGEIMGEEKPEGGFSLGHLKFSDAESEKEEEKEITEGSAKYVKPVRQFVHFRLFILGFGTLLVFSIGLGLFKWVRGRHETHASNVALAQTNPGNPHTKESFTLVGLDNVQVFVRQEEDKQRLFAGTLTKGERQALEKMGPVQISYSEGNHLLIEKADGSQIKPQKNGRGWISLP